MRITTCCAAILSLCFTSVAIAGVQYTQVNQGVDAGSNTTNEIMFEGTKFKSVFTASDNPMMRVGFYMLGTGPGELYMVNPAARKYARLSAKDVQKMQRDMQQGDGGFADQMKAEYTDFKVSKDIDEAGPTTVGLPTRHYRYSISYTESLQPPGSPMKMVLKVKEINEFWASKEFAQLANPAGWTDPSTGAGDASGLSNPRMEEVEQQMAEHGFVVKRIVTREEKMGGMMASMGGGGNSSKDLTEITALDRDATLPAGTFDLPTGFNEVDIVNLMSGGAMPNLNSVPGKGQSSGMPDLDDEPPQ
jgi:hypothetical protein